MYLLACYWSDSPALTALEPYFLARARQLQAEQIGDDISLTHWLQASSLLAHYLACKSRLLEARQEVRPVAIFSPRSALGGFDHNGAFLTRVDLGDDSATSTMRATPDHVVVQPRFRRSDSAMLFHSCTQGRHRGGRSNKCVLDGGLLHAHSQVTSEPLTGDIGISL